MRSPVVSPLTSAVLDASRRKTGAAANPRRVAVVGNYPPRRCGIATFTADVVEALNADFPGAVCDVYAMNDGGRTYAYPDEVAFSLRQESTPDYLEAARRINASAAEVVCVQHEFGIFGGAAGEHLMALLDAVSAPVVVALHTVLEKPDLDQRRVFQRLIARASRVIVMAERGQRILQDVWGVDAAKVLLVPHGAPDRPFGGTGAAKKELGVFDRPVILTFGLLSPGKGIEMVIRAMPAVVGARPDALYIVLGQTHPHLIAHEGERYREGLEALAASLGVAQNVRFVNAYVDHAALMSYLAAADLYVTPYANAAQVTSGTLAYAVALGKAVISTPYWHAQELLADGRGVLVPFNDPEAIAAAAVELLSDPAKLAAVRHAAYEAGRETIWSRLAQRYMQAFAEAADAAAAAPPRASAHLITLRPDRPAALERPQLSLAGVKRMSDGCGMLQHSRFAINDRDHGYCLDDNARALILMNRFAEPGAETAEQTQLAAVYASFIQHAWNEPAGRFRNFMSYERGWLEDAGSDDSFGRGFWAVATTVAEGRRQELRRWAEGLVERVLPHVDAFSSPRANAFFVLGLCALAAAKPSRADVRARLDAKAQALAAALLAREGQDWFWFEDYLSYDNARLPEALIRAGRLLDDARLVDLGLRSLGWLCGRQTAPSGVFRPVGVESFGRYRDLSGLYDQQPLEATATLDACVAAYAVGRDRRWATEGERAYGWFMGRNDLGVVIAKPEEGECYDGLTPHGANLNQGAESVLAFQLASEALRALTEAQHAIRPAAAADRPLLQGRSDERCPSSSSAPSSSSRTLLGSSFGPSTSLQAPPR